jgi:hypothetical protein
MSYVLSVVLIEYVLLILIYFLVYILLNLCLVIAYKYVRISGTLESTDYFLRSSYGGHLTFSLFYFDRIGIEHPMVDVA